MRLSCNQHHVFSAMVFHLKAFRPKTSVILYWLVRLKDFGETDPMWFYNCQLHCRYRIFQKIMLEQIDLHYTKLDSVKGTNVYEVLASFYRVCWWLVRFLHATYSSYICLISTSVKLLMSDGIIEKHLTRVACRTTPGPGLLWYWTYITVNEATKTMVFDGSMLYWMMSETIYWEYLSIKRFYFRLV